MKRFRKAVFLLAGLVIALVMVAEADALVVTSTGDGSTLASEILGGGIGISNILYTGSATASGTFTDGAAAGIGIETGILLTSGTAAGAVGPNNSDKYTSNNGLSGDVDLDALGYSTYDATILEFDFTSLGGDLYFNYVFASEEYNEYTNTTFNDVFAFFLDGTNIALIPGTSMPVSVNNVNGGNPYGIGASNSAYFNNNDLQDGGPFFDIQYDGFTDMFTAQALGLVAGTHHIKLAIADTGDSVLDSGVFIQGGSFSDEPTGVPEPASMLLLGAGLVGIGIARKKFKA